MPLCVSNCARVASMDDSLLEPLCLLRGGLRRCRHHLPTTPRAADSPIAANFAGVRGQIPAGGMPSGQVLRYAIRDSLDVSQSCGGRRDD